MNGKRFILVCRSIESGQLELIEEHVTSIMGVVEGTGEIGIYFAVFGNEYMWTRPMIEEQYEILERLPDAAFFARLGHQAREPEEGR